MKPQQDITRSDAPARPPDEQPTEPSTPQVFAGRYQAIVELGRGGMGRVLRARDLKLGREVALKLLVSGAHDQQQRLRFEQEARAAGALNHPNILAVHDIGEHEGEPYIVTELLDGRTLRSALAEGPLPPEEAVRLTIQLADGLAAAHAKGIVHRDLKPENLFLCADGRLKILDFGIAKLLDGPAPGGPMRTDTGAVMGTPGYMSPEQIRGEAADARSDLFAVGVIVHEMLSGSPPFEAPSRHQIEERILHAESPALPASVPVVLERIVRRCLEKEPSRRFQSAPELAEQLSAFQSQLPAVVSLLDNLRRRRVLRALVGYGIAACALGAAAGLGWRFLRNAGGARASIAVLPFANLSGDPGQDYLSDGIAEEMTSKLSRLRGLPVAARTSVARFKGAKISPGEIGAAPGRRISIGGKRSPLRRSHPRHHRAAQGGRWHPALVRRRRRSHRRHLHGAAEHRYPHRGRARAQAQPHRAKLALLLGHPQRGGV